MVVIDQYVPPGAVKLTKTNYNISVNNRRRVELDIGIPEAEVENVLNWEHNIPLNEYGAGSIPIENFDDGDIQIV